MPRLSVALILTGFVSATALPAFAQQADTQPVLPSQPAQTAVQAEQPADPVVPPAVPTSREQVQPGQTYAGPAFSDWSSRCVRMEEIEDLCDMFQLLVDQNGVQTAEINLIPLSREGVAAAASVVTPLKTLLSRNVAMKIDSGETRIYPFTFCTPIGCVAQFGLSPEEVARLRAGNAATVTIVPLEAPDQQVALTVSLSGFTAAFNALGTPRN